MISRTSASMAALLTLATSVACDRAAAPGRAQAAPASNGTSGGGELTPRLGVPEVAEVLTDAFANAAKAIRPSVVRIDVELRARRDEVADEQEQQLPPDLGDLLRRFFGRGAAQPGPPQPVRGTGSGVIIDDAGHVVTNSHVVERASKVSITLVDGRKFDGRVLGKDPLTDVAVVGFVKKPSSLGIARLGNSDQLRVGQWVLAVGSPLGLDQSVTAGIVSGLGSRGSHKVLGERVHGYVQTDAAINPGNSGGPLVNLAAEVVGINTLINVGPGGAYGYAIPINQVAQVSTTLIKEGRVRYPYIGVTVESAADLPEEARAQLGQGLPKEGAIVINVVPGSPGADAGMRPGDVITKIGDRPVGGASDLVDYVSGQKIGATASLQLWRDGKTRSVNVTLREMPTEEGAPSASALGLSLQPLSESLSRSLGLGRDVKGVVVADVAAGSAAERAGLHPGDVIVEVDRKHVASVDAALAALRDKKQHLLRVVGPSGARFVTITPG
jgi:serine protease Do